MHRESVDKETRLIMGMPISVLIAEPADPEDIEAVFGYFTEVDRRFSTYKEDSEISAINRGEIAPDSASEAMREVFAIAERTKQETSGYFDIKRPDGTLDPSGIVKGWAIRNAAQLLRERGYKNFYIDAGGDIASEGVNRDGKPWSVGIRDPFARDRVVKVITPEGKGVATSGSYIRGDHIYDPLAPESRLDEIVSLTVVAPDILEADRLATAAFAMGRRGINFIASAAHCDGYMIDRDGIATMTEGFLDHISK